MPRYEFSEGSSNKFWEIELAGTKFTCRFGKIGATGQTTLKEFKSAAEAKTAYEKLIAEKTKKGYVLAGGSAKKSAAAAGKTAKATPAKSTSAHNAKLEAAIEANPDNPDAYLVYADWLQAQGDPRGELIVLQHGNKKKQAQKLLDGNAEHFFGKLAGFRICLKPFPHDPLGRDTTWRWGFLEAAWISTKYEHSYAHQSGTEFTEFDVEEGLGWLLDHPSARFLRELAVGIVEFTENDYSGIAKVIGKRSLPTLRKLILGDFYYEETELNWSAAGKLEPLYKAVPNLESLTVRSGSMKLGKLELPKLRELILITGGLDKGSLASVCAQKWPHLETLNVQIGSDGNVRLAHLQPIFDGKLFPKVKHLGLGNSEIADEICAQLASSKIAAQLESLDMSLSTLGDAGAAALAAGKFPKLHKLDVTKCFLSKKGLAVLKPLAKTISSKEQEQADDPEDRYIQGYE